MRINHNLQAMNTQRMGKLNQAARSQAMERLSSGFRINRAGDDAAGLAISEKMRGQIRGLNQAARNAQDGISLVQTAEGAAGTIHGILQRARSLSVQAANDTLTADDRDKAQEEIDQLVGQIDTVASNTEFNKIKLLDSSNNTMSEFSGVPQATIDELTSKLPGYINDGLVAVRDQLDVDMPDSPTKRNMDIEYYFETSGGAAGATMGTSDGGASLTLRVNIASVTDSNGSLIDEGSLDGLIAHEVTHAMQFTEMAFATDGVTETSETHFIEGMAMLIQGGNSFGTIDNSATIGGAWGGSSQDYAEAFAAMKTLHEITTGGISAFIERLEAGDTLDQAFANTVQGNSAEGGASQIINGTDFATANAFVTWFDGAGPDNYLDNSSDFTLGTGAVTDGSTQGSSSNLSLDDTITNGTGTALVNTHFDLTFTNPAEESYTDIVFQIGANSGQRMRLDPKDLSALSLGVSTLSIQDSDNAQASITVIDEAISEVSSVRSYYGSVMNRLEHTVKNLQVAAENMQSSESRIRDLDMASGMMKYTKSNILSQAAQAMLAQANQSSSGVLNVLSG